MVRNVYNRYKDTVLVWGQIVRNVRIDEDLMRYEV